MRFNNIFQIAGDVYPENFLLNFRNNVITCANMDMQNG